MNKPLVSVIMTAYNCQKFIGEAMKSVFNQTYKNYEFIVFNDSSTDNTWQVIQDNIRWFEKNYIIVNKVLGDRGGCGVGRNEAIGRAKGKYIAIQDADDISYPYRLEKQVDFMESNPDIFCVGSWADRIDSKGDKIEEMTYPPEDHNSIVETIFKKTNPIIDPSAFFIRETFNDLGRYESKWDLVPDLHLWVRALIKKQRFANIPEKLVEYRKHSGSVMSKNLQETVRQHRDLHKNMLEGHKKEGFLK